MRFLHKLQLVVREEELHVHDHPAQRAQSAVRIVQGVSLLVAIIFAVYQATYLYLHHGFDLRPIYIAPVAIVVCAGPLAHLLLKHGYTQFLSRYCLIGMHTFLIGLAFWLDCFTEPSLCVVYVPLIIAVGPVMLLRSIKAELVMNTAALAGYFLAAWLNLTPIAADHAVVTGSIAYMLSLTSVIVISMMRYTIATTSRELERQNATAQLEHSQRLQLQEALAAAQQASIAKTSFINNVSHDVLTPMNAIMGYNNHALANVEDTAEVKKSLEHIGMASQQLLKYLNGILDMTSNESGREGFTTSTFSLAGLVSDLSAQLAPRLKANSLHFDTSNLNIENDMVSADRKRLSQVLEILLDNSINYTPTGGHISLGITQGQRMNSKRVKYTFTVEDDGIGMSKGFLKNIFDPFSREHNTTEGGVTGAGLGLPMAKTIIEASSGTIAIESEQGQGTKVSFTLPLGVEDRRKTSGSTVPEAAMATGRTTAPQNTTERLKGARVLVVDDNAINREVAADLLEERGFKVDTAASGAQALKLFSESEQGRYTAVLMDIMMPEMDGMETTRALRKLDRADAQIVPIIALSANAHSSSSDDAIAAGMNMFLAKPFQVDSFVRILNEWL